MILPINTYSDPVLAAKAKPLKGVDSSIRELIADMFDSMNKAPGIGLAAPQVGHSIRLLVADISTIKEYADFKPMVVINPRIVSVAGRNSMEEGCLSVPGVAGEVVRPSRITLHYRDEKFEEHTEEFSGMMARVLQHEIDHLDGTLFVDRMEKRDRRKVQKKLDAIKQGRVKTSYPIARNAVKAEAEV
ncbi:MAG TPA: peptide deformylase [Chlorobaculum parvum]|uniref:Peptide deformylase n=1 Tax=Chlorobaculum parvum TaxID=274539 RepID=A0A7C5DBC6_9CHLB|nr:peptide deformylase [Chlorobaculum parvum]